MIASLLALWAAAFPLMGSPGPATMSLAAIGSAFGVRAGLSYLAGIIAGTFGVLLLIATGVTGLILAMPALRLAISILAAAYILYLAYRIATAPPMGSDGSGQPPPSFPSGFALAIANPKAFAAIGAVYAGATLIEGSLIFDAINKIAALTFVIVVVNSGWLVFGLAISAVLRHPRLGRIANWIFSILLVGSVLMALA